MSMPRCMEDYMIGVEHRSSGPSITKADTMLHAGAPHFIGGALAWRCTVNEKRAQPTRIDRSIIVGAFESPNQKGRSVPGADHLLFGRGPITGKL